MRARDNAADKYPDAEDRCTGNGRDPVPTVAFDERIERRDRIFPRRNAKDIVIERVRYAEGDQSGPEIVRKEMAPRCHASETEHRAEREANDKRQRSELRMLSAPEPPSGCIQVAHRTMPAGEGLPMRI